MFRASKTGFLELLAALLCGWGAAYHTPVGAAARDTVAWVRGTQSTSRPWLAYYSGGYYDAQEIQAPEVLPPPAMVATSVTPTLALGYGVYSVWAQLKPAQRPPGMEQLSDRVQGPHEANKLIEKLSATLGSEDAAVMAIFIGMEPARYAADRVRAIHAEPTLEELGRVLPPGYEAELGFASRAMTLGTAYGLAWPVPEDTRVTSPFGWRDNPVTGRHHLHTGVDLAVPIGTSVHVVAHGKVRRASEDAVNGKVLIVDHGRGVTTAYCHNSSLRAEVGNEVSPGAIISLSGSTGRSTGPHLHYQLELGHQPVDPFLFRASR